MHALTVLIFIALGTFGCYWVVHQVARLIRWLGPKACVAALLAVWAAVWLNGSREPQPGGASAYREAQAALERATGRPCDYACKVMIADQSRRGLDAPPQ